MAAVKVYTAGKQAKLGRVPTAVKMVSCIPTTNPPASAPMIWYTATDRLLWTKEYVYLRFSEPGVYEVDFD